MFISKKNFRLYFIFFLFFNICIANSNVVNMNDDEYKRQMLEQTIEYFYFDPQESTAKKIIKEIESLDHFFYVLVALTKKYKHSIVKWINELNIDFKKNPHIINSLYIANLPGEAMALAKKAKWPTKEIIKIGSFCPSVFDIPHTFPGFIKWMITEFFISGNTEYIKRIFEIFELSEKDVASKDELKMLIEEAKETLRFIIFKHDKIYKLCKEEIKLNKKKSKEVLTKLLSELNRSPEHFTHIKKGGLSGTILISDDPDFEKNWYTIPINSKVECKSDIQSLPYPKEDKTIKIFILFNCFKLNENSFSDVTYDIEIFNPKNERISFYKDLVALKKKITSRFLIQLAEQTTSLDFILTTPSKKGIIIKPGIYTIKVALKDNISKKILNLKSSLKINPE